MAARILAMVQAGAIITAQGTHLPARIDTVCLHGDGPSAVATARKLRETLEDADVTLAQFDGSRG
jgi:UPF0271 protein